jgi:hypothetical protein
MSETFDEQTLLDGWPNCTTPDCQYKACTWADVDWCFQCAVCRLGRSEVIRRYDATHERPWADTDSAPNYLL